MSQNLKASKTAGYPYALAEKKIENKQKNIIINQLMIGLKLFFFKFLAIKSLNPSTNSTKIK